MRIDTVHLVNKRKRGELIISDIMIKPIWSDSMGAKSFSLFIDTGDARILIDPGVSAMQPSFPISDSKKYEYAEKALSRITKYARQANIVTITHYHYDHFRPTFPELYAGKIVLAKDPNQFINESQRERAVDFYTLLSDRFLGKKLEFSERKNKIIGENPLQELPRAMSINYGDYTERKRELLNKGMKWYNNLVEKWNRWPEIPEIETDRVKWIFADGKTFRFGTTKIRFMKPMFHGIEFSRVGWVIPIVIEKESVKILYTSDLNGPIIEDYAEWIIKENPDVLFIDGPATYMIPYTLNMINFRRSVENLKRIIRNVKAKYIFLDHHLTRDIRFRVRLKEVYELARKEKKIITFSEFHGRKAIAEKVYLAKKKKK